MNIYEIIEVRSYAGFRSEESPRSFIFRDREYIVTEIIDRWYEGGVIPNQTVYNYFKVETESGDEFILRYNAKRDVWAICLSIES